MPARLRERALLRHQHDIAPEAEARRDVRPGRVAAAVAAVDRGAARHPVAVPLCACDYVARRVLVRPAVATETPESVKMAAQQGKGKDGSAQVYPGVGDVADDVARDVHAGRLLIHIDALRPVVVMLPVVYHVREDFGADAACVRVRLEADIAAGAHVCTAP